ncbi:MAG: endonuclease/exonuclease/phosphatase family protein [Bacteroidales bacterium]|jgi:endonuclease/exonuclease/phosphatase family metal-dependent hydrolase|nr:endonuclease/exonuclease/phosphatase family protein [Bacteroidales bacterium]
MAKDKISFLNIIFLICNGLAAVGLVAAYLSNYLNPKLYFLTALCGLFYPYIVAVNICFIILWLIRKRRYCFISLLTILLGFNSLQRLYQFQGEDIPSDTTNLVKVLSYNVQILDAYTKKSANRETIIRFLQEESPDITCLQEYCQHNTPQTDFITTSELQQLLDAKDNYLYMPLTRNSYQFGMVIFSRYPIVHRGRVIFSNAKTNHAMYADIKINEDTIRVYNIHFQSIHFGAEDYMFARQATSNTDISNKEWKKGSMRILRKIKRGYSKRSAQVDSIVNHIEASPYKVIVCGDFNDTPCSYTYKQIRNLLDDAFVESGKGFGYSMIINRLLSFRIDYIFHDKSFRSYEFKTKVIKASDHYPVSAFLKLE